MKKIKRMFKNEKITAVMMVICLALTLAAGSILTSSTAEAATKKTATVKKPGQVKGLKKVKMNCKWDGYRNVSSVKIKFNKVKGATGYQVLVYRTNRTPGLKTPLIYAYTTKKTTYTIKNLDPDFKITVKVRAYVKDKSGRIIYGKAKSIKFKTSGKEKGFYIICNTCGAAMPSNDNLLGKHTVDAYKIHKEVHAGYTIYWR